MAHSSIHQFIGRRQDDLDRLVPRNFIALYDPDRLERLPLYIRAILIRTQRAVVDLEKDHRKAEIIRPFSEHLDIMLSTLSPATSAAKRHAIESYFWLLEAFKVSVFAQELKAPQPVSARRLEEKIAEIDRMT
jgi:ATP-dependent helicase HrpA